LNNVKKKSKYLFFGEENIGKTALLRIAYSVLYERNFIPIYLEGKNIKDTGIDDIKKIVEKAFTEQYGVSSLDEYRQEDISNIFILIDDIDKNLLKSYKAKGRLIKTVSDYYCNVILTGNELSAFEEILIDEETIGDVFSDFYQYEILEFNHSNCYKLIRKWYTIGQDEYLSDEEFYKKIDGAVHSISIAMGQRIVPNYPIFVLILLQAIETSNPHDLRISSYGNYYQMLILKSLTDNIREQSELNIYQIYCEELANLFFSKKTKNISYKEYADFYTDMSGYEKMDLPSSMTIDKTIEDLSCAGIIYLKNDTIGFRYLYNYYYYEAKYLSRNLIKVETKDIVSKLCKRLYRTEYANIVMFLIHFSGDEFIVKELINNANEIFSGLSPCGLENDIININKLVEELPKLYFESKSIEAVREEENNQMDQDNNPEESEIKEECDISEDLSEIDEISKINLAFKLIEILGQILKNNPSGSMSGPVKHQMLISSYSLGLRTLSLFFDVINDNSDFVINQIKEILSKYKHVEKEKIEKIARQFTFGFCTHLSYLIVKKISYSVGSNKLIDKYYKIQEELNYSSVKIINFIIKLDQQSGFPDRELQNVKEFVEKYPLSYFLLKKVVIMHLYRHPVQYRDKQRICQFLGISIENQFKIDDKRKKGEK